MSWRTTLLAVVLMAASAAGLFWIFQRQVAGPSPAFYVPDEVLPALEESLEDQKRLAELDPEEKVAYRERFDKIETTVGRLRILEHNRERLVRRYELVLLGLLAASVALATVYLAVRHSRYAPRLARIQSALADLAVGPSPVAIGDQGRDPVGRISRMIESTSLGIARDRRRLRALRNLSRWQEAAKRHAHEMRTPLNGARLTLDRIRGVAAKANPDLRRDLEAAVDGLGFELERLGRFTEEFASFARLRPPDLEREDLGALVSEFVEAYQGAWPNLRLEFDSGGKVWVAADRDMIRQVLANLCDNSSKALGVESGVVHIELEPREQEARLSVFDNGPGIAPAIRERLFEPYTSTRAAGEGMGLGLAISLKILLDHGGDLELLDSSEAGTAFGLSLPIARDS
ncbi:MAG: PAS domain-containing sensor histidine kinase [Thermoanaerobaculia bacterium]